MVLKFARLTNQHEQHATYNGYKNKYTLNFSTSKLLDGPILHAQTSWVGSKNDQTFYRDNDMDAQLERFSNVDDRKFWNHGHTGYNGKHCPSTSLAEATLTPAMRAANKATGKVRVIVEWF